MEIYTICQECEHTINDSTNNCVSCGSENVYEYTYSDDG